MQHLVPMQQLFDAIKAGKVDEVRQLVQQNPSLTEARDASGASAILVAAYNMKPDVVNALLELGAPVDIFEASVLGKVDRIQEILKSSPARVSEHAPDGFTPVALAAFFGQPAAVKALIAAGADVNAAAKNPLKVAALHAAVAGGKLDIVKAVLEAGADPNAQQQAGFRADPRSRHEGESRACRVVARARRRSVVAERRRQERDRSRAREGPRRVRRLAGDDSSPSPR